MTILKFPSLKQSNASDKEYYTASAEAQNVKFVMPMCGVQKYKTNTFRNLGLEIRIFFSHIYFIFNRNVFECYWDLSKQKESSHLLTNKDKGA